ncbi:MAG: ABC transporter ATP-binding protein [Oscillospiraceae bacterium]|jgi:putative ABC transport system ATP-binding protein|nr:ABC transporter ATP-binding protein [Oscillospiraceae bacterium]
MSTLTLENVAFAYEKGRKVLQDLNYSFDAGKVYAIVGRSGAGKTTLLSLLSGLTSPTGGKILREGHDLQAEDRATLRSRHVGIIFQSFNLLPHLNARENVELSIRASGKKQRDVKGRALALLASVGLDTALAERRVLKLSGGEQQRVAIARALSIAPEIILADEPTGNLDLTTQDEIMTIFKRLAHEEGKCVILVSHSPDVARMADEVYELAPLRKK